MKPDFRKQGLEIGNAIVSRVIVYHNYLPAQGNQRFPH